MGLIATLTDELSIIDSQIKVNENFRGNQVELVFPDGTRFLRNLGRIQDDYLACPLEQRDDQVRTLTRTMVKDMAMSFAPEQHDPSSLRIAVRSIASMAGPIALHRDGTLLNLSLIHI